MNAKYFSEVQPFYRASAMREVDRQTYMALGISEYALMCQAGGRRFGCLSASGPKPGASWSYAGLVTTVETVGFWRDWLRARALTAGLRYSETLPVYRVLHAWLTTPGATAHRLNFSMPKP